MTEDIDTIAPFASPFARTIWEQKYRLRAADGTIIDHRIEDTWQRVAKTIAKAEPEDTRALWAERFYDAMSDFAFLPAGRILAGAGSERRLTLFNCFVMAPVPDDLAGIFDSVREAAVTMQQGGGIGVDFSALRPRGAPVAGTGSDASGPVSFMDVWDTMCSTIMSSGARRGAMMGTLRCDHPDIEEFIEAKSDPTRLRHFNLSVLVTDAFMDAVRNGQSFDLTFAGKVVRSLDARTLWHKIMVANFNYAEPGVIFIDRINAQNPLSYCEQILTTNPCGEQPLPPYGACLLGALNLTRLIKAPFSPQAHLDEERLSRLTAIAVRFLDNAIDVSPYPLPAQAAEARAKRRIGLGITGLADALAMCGLRYGSEAALATTRSWLSLIARTAFETSTRLAKEKGSFPLFDARAYLASARAQRLPQDLRRAILQNGLRNGLLTSIAPTGTISLLAGNVSSGIEPIFELAFKRRVLQASGQWHEEIMEDYASRLYRQMFGQEASLPDVFVTSQTLTPEEHLAQQAALQPYVDSAISKTINCPPTISFDDFRAIYERAYELGLKGCTTYRPNPVTGSILSPATTSNKEQESGSVATFDTGIANAASEVVYLNKPQQREPVLSGRTYKLKWPTSDHALYITINDSCENGRRRPFEIFINTKSLEHYAWVVALTRMISAIFRRGGDVSFVIEELQAIFDPKGGVWMGGRYVPSLIAAIGNIIEQHMRETGALANHTVTTPQTRKAAGADTTPEKATIIATPTPPFPQNTRFCPKCNQPSLAHREGCLSCTTCGYSECG